MRLRQRMLPGGWYPDSQSGCVAEIESFTAGVRPLPAGVKVYGGMIPHAGWYFSGKLAARVFQLNALVTQPQVVCIFGGHLAGNSPPLLAAEDAWETPLGTLTLATEFYQPLAKRLPLREESPGDNSIEVQLPLAGAGPLPRRRRRRSGRRAPRPSGRNWRRCTPGSDAPTRAGG